MNFQLLVDEFLGPGKATVISSQGNRLFLASAATPKQIFDLEIWLRAKLHQPIEVLMTEKKDINVLRRIK
jgi:hypothetical protein